MTKGIIVTSSCEARAKGVKTTMPVWKALKLCPNLILLPPHFQRYKEASQAMFELLKGYTPLVEPVSIDEGFLDATYYLQEGNPIQLAEEIQSRLLKEMDLPCSIGIAPVRLNQLEENRSFYKVAVVVMLILLPGWALPKYRIG